MATATTGPTARAARRSRGPTRYYVGRRPDETEVHVVSAADVKPLEHLCYRSEAPFDWGSTTPGARELAFALLFDTAQSDPPGQVCEAFLDDVVAGLDTAGFVLNEGDVALWLLTAFRGGGDRSDRGHKGTGRRHWWLRWLPRRRAAS